MGAGAANFNEIRFEDKKSSEQLFIHAEKNQDIEVENDETHGVGHDRKKTIDCDEITHVKHDRTETVDNNETITVHANRTETVDKNETITIHQNRTETVDKDEGITIQGGRTKTVAKDGTISVGGTRSAKITGDDTVQIGKSLTINATDTITIKVGSASFPTDVEVDGAIAVHRDVPDEQAQHALVLARQGPRIVPHWRQVCDSACICSRSWALSLGPSALVGRAWSASSAATRSSFSFH